MSAKFTKANVRKWMGDNWQAYEEGETREVNCTALAEAAAAEFGQNETGGPLDDETHWIWEEAARY